MGLKFNLAVISKEDIEKAENDQGGRYTGPTPPADSYNVKIRKAWFVKFKNGDDAIRVMLIIDEKGPKKIYNGCAIFYSMTLPKDPESQYFGAQVKALVSFVKNASGGKIEPKSFFSALTKGAIKSEEPDDRGNIPVTQVGKFRFDKDWEITVQTKLSPNAQDPTHPWVNVHYIHNVEPKEAVEETPEEDDLDVDVWDTGDDEGDDLDEMIEGFDD